MRIYKLSQNLKRVEAEFELIQDDLVLNDSYPVASWHSQTTLTEKGVVFFETHGEGEPDEDPSGDRTGPFSIKLLILDFERGSVKTLLQFKIKSKAKNHCYGVYLFNSMDGKVLQYDSDQQFLHQNYFVVYDNYGLTIRKLSEPSKVLHRIRDNLSAAKPPLVFRFSKDC
jgi:hypothetical protein